jgi:hypothetical protein
MRRMISSMHGLGVDPVPVVVVVVTIGVVVVLEVEGAGEVGGGVAQIAALS